MTRRITAWLVIILLVAAFLTGCVAWVGSYWRQSTLYPPSWGYDAAIVMDQGRLAAIWADPDGQPTRAESFVRLVNDPNRSVFVEPPVTMWTNRWGFGYRSNPVVSIWTSPAADATYPDGSWRGSVSRDIFNQGVQFYGGVAVVPGWSIVLPWGLLTAMLVYLLVRRIARQTHGRCTSCGYDLRGSADACPECGQTLQATRNPPPSHASTPLAASLRSPS
ncbi:MAG: hypothetical protein AAGB29_05945 [Planctomycetota bacterium]